MIVLPVVAALAVTYLLVDRWHGHECPRDGTRWRHGAFWFSGPSIRKAHTCPTCGLDWRWVAGPLGCDHAERARADDAARIRAGEKPLYQVEHQ